MLHDTKQDEQGQVRLKKLDNAILTGQELMSGILCYYLLEHLCYAREFPIDTHTIFPFPFLFHSIRQAEKPVAVCRSFHVHACTRPLERRSGTSMIVLQVVGVLLRTFPELGAK